MDNSKEKYYVHATSIIEEGAVIGEGCHIGPYCTIGSKVKLGANIKLISHVVIDGDTTINDGNIIYPGVTIGLIPQDLKYKGEDTKIIIGKNNRIRENSTIHLGTKEGIGITTIGDNCLFMVNSHVAHDVIVGNDVVIANNVMLAGHVVIEDEVTIGGGSAVHQFCRIGTGAFIGGLSGITADIIPYSLFSGIREEGKIMGVNIIGLKRKGYSKAEIDDIRNTFDVLFSKKYNLRDNIETLKEMYNSSSSVGVIIRFLNTTKGRNIFSNMKGASQPEKKKPFMYKFFNKLITKYL